MDRILSYLPETVHIRVGYDNESQYYGDHSGVEWVDYEIPKAWLKHGEPGHYDEWTIKKTYEKKFISLYGNKPFSSCSRWEVIEWNQLQDVVIILQKANKLGFTNILDAASQVKIEDAKYFNKVLI